MKKLLHPRDEAIWHLGCGVTACGERQANGHKTDSQRQSSGSRVQLMSGPNKMPSINSIKLGGAWSLLPRHVTREARITLPSVCDESVGLPNFPSQNSTT